MTQDYEEVTYGRSRAGMVLCAIGATFAMLPTSIMTLLGSLEALRIDDDMTSVIGIGIVTGMLLWAIGSFVCIGPLSKNGSTWAGVLMGIFLLLGLTGFFIIGLNENPEYLVIRALYSGDLELGAFMVCAVIFAFHLVLALCCRKIGQSASGMTMTGSMFWVIACIPFALMIVSYLMFNEARSSSWYYGTSGSYGTYQTLLQLLVIATCICAVIAVIGFWVGVGSGIRVAEVEEEQPQIIIEADTRQESHQAYMPQNYQYQMPQQPQQPQYQPQQPQYQPQQPQALPANLRENLLSMSNEQLQGVLAYPQHYSDAYVAEAASILRKRNAWERIQNHTDEQLIEIVKQEEADYDIADAASMELFSRQSPLLFAELEGETPESLKYITDNPDQYLEGYVEAAKQILGNQPLA